jgi:shikimate kinase
MTPADAPIFLVGYRGTGKTTVAQELASRLSFDWIDADDVVEQQAGKSITAIFAEDGEAAFRDCEQRVVAELTRKRRTIVALGGGAVLSAVNRQVMRAAGPVVWLTASVDSILERLAADPTTAGRRPNLTPAGGKAEIEALLAQRTPLYRECATFMVDTEGKTAADVADEIAANLLKPSPFGRG